MQRRCLVVVALLHAATCACAGEELAFWPGVGVKGAAGFRSLQEHPCGEVAYATVQRLPAIGRGPLLPELVVELNAKGNVVRRWSMPVDFTPEAVRGEELLVSFGERRLWVRPNGTYVRGEPGDRANAGRVLECNLKAHFGESGYAQCRAMHDARTGRERVIGYQGACT